MGHEVVGLSPTALPKSLTVRRKEITMAFGIRSYAQKLKAQVANFFWPEQPEIEPSKRETAYSLVWDKAPAKCASVRIKKSKASRAIRRHKRQQRITNA